MIELSYNGKTIVRGPSIADNFWDRLLGYMFRSTPHTPGILFEPAISIHTFFMKFSLDVVFMDQNFRVLKVYRNLRPWRHTGFFFRSRKTLEIPAGVLPAEIREGDILEVRNV
jgi:uncharacterized membrane protein (UPF0127 family)